MAARITEQLSIDVMPLTDVGDEARRALAERQAHVAHFQCSNERIDQRVVASALGICEDVSPEIS